MIGRRVVSDLCTLSFRIEDETTGSNQTHGGRGQNE